MCAVWGESNTHQITVSKTVRATLEGLMECCEQKIFKLKYSSLEDLNDQIVMEVNLRGFKVTKLLDAIEELFPYGHQYMHVLAERINEVS